MSSHLTNVTVKKQYILHQQVLKEVFASDINSEDNHLRHLSGEANSITTYPVWPFQSEAWGSYHLTSPRNENRGRSEFGHECCFTTLPLQTQFWDVHVSMTEHSHFCINMLELLNEKGGTEREVRWLYTMPVLCPGAWCSEELQYRTLPATTWINHFKIIA